MSGGRTLLLWPSQPLGFWWKPICVGACLQSDSRAGTSPWPGQTMKLNKDIQWEFPGKEHVGRYPSREKGEVE